MGPFGGGGSDFSFLSAYVGFLQVVLFLLSALATLVVLISVGVWLYALWDRLMWWLEDRLLGEGAKQRREARRKAAIDRFFR